MVLLRERVLQFEVKIFEKYLRRSSFFNKVAGCTSPNLLKMNSFASIFEYFNRRFTWLLSGKPIFTEITVFLE